MATDMTEKMSPGSGLNCWSGVASDPRSRADAFRLGKGSLRHGLHRVRAFIATQDHAVADRTASTWAKREGIERPRVKRWSRLVDNCDHFTQCPALKPEDYLSPDLCVWRPGHRSKS